MGKTEFLFYYFFIEVRLTYNVVLVSRVEQSNSVYVCVCTYTHIFFFVLFSIVIYFRKLEYSSLCHIVKSLLSICFTYTVCIC